MPASERAKKGLMKKKKAGILKEPYQSMSEEELIETFEKRLAQNEPAIQVEKRQT